MSFSLRRYQHLVRRHPYVFGVLLGLLAVSPHKTPFNLGEHVVTLSDIELIGEIAYADVPIDTTVSGEGGGGEGGDCP